MANGQREIGYEHGRSRPDVRRDGPHDHGHLRELEIFYLDAGGVDVVSPDVEGVLDAVAHAPFDGA